MFCCINYGATGNIISNCKHMNIWIDERSQRAFGPRSRPKGYKADENADIEGRLRGTVRRRSRFGDGPRKACIRLRPALERYRPRDMERPFGKFALFGVLDRSAKLD